MSNREKAKRLYLQGKKVKEIADELNIKQSTIRSWKLRDKWPNFATKKRNDLQNEVATQNVATHTDNVISTDKKFKLNNLQQLFCEFYVQSFNATQSYIKAYNADYKTAMVNGCRLLKNANIKLYVNYLKELKHDALMADAEDIVEKMMKIAFSDIGDYVRFGIKEIPIVTKDGKSTGLKSKVNYIDLNESLCIDTSLIDEISEGKGGVKIKLLDRMKALEWLGKYFVANPMDKHRIEYDNKKQELDKLEYERRKKSDEESNW